MISNIQLSQMASAIYLNLSYLESVSNTKLLSESSIRYPLVEFAERRLRDSKIQLEFSHPTYERRRCDLLISDLTSNNVFEFKYVRENTHTEFQEYFDDLIRLHNLHSLGYKAFFIVCGNSILFNKEFRNLSAVTKIIGTKRGRPSGVFAKCLSFSVKNTNKTIDTTKYKANYSSFVADYKFRTTGKVHPAKEVFDTRLVFLKYDGSPQSVGIWEVL